MNKEKLFESINAIDDDILERSEKTPAKKPRRAWLKWGALAAGICIVTIGVILGIRAGHTRPSEILDNTDSAYCYASVVNYNGSSYESISEPDNFQLGKKLGTVELDLKGFNGEVDESIISSTVLAPGDMIYEWAGYSKEFRICGKKADGTIIYFERQRAEGMERETIAELFPENSTVTKITICDNYPTQLGEITDRQQIENILEVFKQQAAFTDIEDEKDRPSMGDDSRRLYLTLEDGSQTEILLYNGEIGSWIGYIALPDSFWDMINSSIIYEGGETYLNYGALYADIDFYNYGGSGGNLVNSNYAMEPVWAVNGELRMGSYKGGGYIVLAKDAAGFIRIENNDIWYLNTSGAVAHIRFLYSGDQGSFYDSISNGKDLSSAITVREVLYPGPFISLKVRDGVVWTLNDKGILAKNGEQIAAGVACYALDSGGVTFGGADGLFREPLSGGKTIQLANGPVTAVAAAGIRVYYATSSGEIRRVNVDGTKEAPVFGISAIALQYFGDDRNGGLAILGSDGKAYLLYQESLLYLTAENAAGIEVNPYGIVAILYKNGELELTWSSHEPGNGGLYLRDGFILPVH